MSQDEKNNKIKDSMKATKERHAQMECRVFEIKVVSSKMPKSQRDQVNQYFREAKWRRNSIIADLEHADRNGRTATVKVGDVFEERDLNILGSQVRQDLYDSVKSEIKGLHTKKERGEKVGALGFKSYCNSIPLRQFGTTYRIDFQRNRIKVQNIKKEFYVRGLKQIPQDADITNAKFIRKASGLYFHITCYIPYARSNRTGHIEGIDFGIGHNLTFTDGSYVDIDIPESKSVKLASKRVNKALHKSSVGKKAKNHYKRKKKLRCAYERDANRRKDAANKLVHDILTNNDFVAIQDEMIHNWHSGLFGKQVQHSAMGTIKAKLKNSSKVVMIERSFPSTQMCPVCGCLTKHPLSKRDYDCPHCGYHHNSRDQKSAQSILTEALRQTSNIQVSPEQRAQSLVETTSAASVSLGADCKMPSVKQEAQVL